MRAQNVLDMGVADVKYETVEMMPMGDKNAVEIGKLTAKIQPEEGAAITATAKYVVVWKYEDESWKLDIDIWN